MKDDYVFPRDRSGAPGIELRDWFAGLAIAGLAGTDMGFLSQDIAESADSAAIKAYIVADAMLAVREAD